MGEVLAAVDIGTNSVHLVVARFAGTHAFEVLAREKEIVGLVAHGLSNSDIATALTISHATAKTHVSRAMAKLGARDRAQLVVLAYQHHLVEPPGQAERA